MTSLLSAEARKQVTEALQRAFAVSRVYANNDASYYTDALALLASLPEAPAVEANPSVQGLATWLRIEAESGGVTWEQIHQLRAWASAVESLALERTRVQRIEMTDAQRAALTVSGPVSIPGAAPQAVPAQADMTDALHSAIMNLPCNVPAGYPFGSELCIGVYRQGHRDARHAAAELVSAGKETP